MSETSTLISYSRKDQQGGIGRSADPAVDRLAHNKRGKYAGIGRGSVP
jgi:hypothetical protein